MQSGIMHKSESARNEGPMVVIIQRRLTHYRLPLFVALKNLLADRGIRLKLLVGQGTSEEEKKRDGGELEWAIKMPTRYFLNGKLCWQPVGEHLDDAHLVIVTHENKLLQNHLLMLKPRRFQMAFWGHGANLQSKNTRGVKERFKRWTSKRVDWWFPYTELSADVVARCGFPRERMSVLNNSVDTSEIRAQRQSISDGEIQALRESMGLSDAPVGIFVGSLYADKRLDFLFDAATAIHREISEFRLLIVGQGPQAEQVRTWCSANPWCSWVGAKYGREKVTYLATAKIMLNPGLVGLGILDAFCCTVPLFTTDCGIHAPEIAYLKNQINGVVTPDSIAEFADACVGVLQDATKLARLRAGCRESSQLFTIENMACRFADGITAALR